MISKLWTVKNLQVHVDHFRYCQLWCDKLIVGHTVYHTDRRRLYRARTVDVRQRIARVCQRQRALSSPVAVSAFCFLRCFASRASSCHVADSVRAKHRHSLGKHPRALILSLINRRCSFPVGLLAIALAIMSTALLPLLMVQWYYVAVRKRLSILVTKRWARSWSRCTGSQPAGDLKPSTRR